MTQPQVLEGFRRIAVIVGVLFALIAVYGVVLFEPGTDGWATKIRVVALGIPTAWFIGYLSVRCFGWVISGFFLPEPSSLEIITARVYVRMIAISGYVAWVIGWLISALIPNAFLSIFSAIAIWMVLAVAFHFIGMLVGEAFIPIR